MTLRKRLKDLLHAMVGVPSYERYLAHKTALHPAEIPLSYEDFYKLAQSRRYSGRQAKCC